MPEIKQQRWKIVEYSKRQINDAGNIIRKDNTTAEELAFATQVIDNWRAAHAASQRYPCCRASKAIRFNHWKTQKRNKNGSVANARLGWMQIYHSLC